MLEYLHRVILPHTNCQPSILTLDCYTAHLTPSVLRFAVTHNIRFVTIPAQTTSTLQPLDVKVFGCVKNKWTSAWTSARQTLDDSSQHPTPPSSTFNHAISLLSPILSCLQSSHIRSAFKQAWSPLFTTSTSSSPNQSNDHSESKTSEQQHPASSSTSSSSVVTPAPCIPYHWVDPQFKPSQKFLLNPSEQPPPAPKPRRKRCKTSSSTTTAPALPAPPADMPFAGLVCIRCHVHQQYFRRCACTPLPLCVSCVPMTYVCFLCCFPTVLL